MNQPARTGAAEAPAFSTLLIELQSAHHQLVVWMDAVDASAQQEALDKQQFAHVRWQLGKARRDWRLLGDRIQQMLLPHLDAAGQAELTGLRRSALRSLEAISSHLMRWHPGAVAEDRPAFFQATGAIRGLWMQTIENERRLLYPLLRRQG